MPRDRLARVAASEPGVAGVSYVLELQQIQCKFGDRLVVDRLSMAVSPGSLVCLLGPSGCGKTTALRAIAGFQPVSAGEVRINAEVVSRPGYTLAPEKRRLGMVFQDNALFPHQRVAENIAAGLRHQPREPAQTIVDSLTERVGLGGLAGRYPHELSGGQQQRVALARALAPQPALLLMDEPFSNLDLELRERLGQEVRELLKEQGTTCVLVTHDQHDAFALGDKVGVLADGRILQWDTPYNLYHEPNSRFVADFIGEGVFLPGTLLAPDAVHTELGTIRGNRAYGWGEGSAVDVLIRPDDIVPGDSNDSSAVVVRKAFKGAETLYDLRLPAGRHVLSLFPSHVDHAVGERVHIRLQADHLVAFRSDESAS